MYTSGEEELYACLSAVPDADWLPGRVVDVKEYPGFGYGPVRKYDVAFEGGGTKSNLHEIWVMKKAEYELSLQRPEKNWVGITVVRFPESKDQYAKLIGWYETCLGGVTHTFSSLAEVLEHTTR